MSDTRRDFLKKAALLSGAASLSQLLPDSIQRALAINPAEGSTWRDAEHIVILMQENRSFDHALGTLRGVRGYNDPRVIELPNRHLVWLQSNSEGQTYAPFHLDIKNTRATWMDSLPHSWANQVNARNDGKYDQWLNVKRNSIAEYANMPLTMGFHTREDLPFYYALADAFTVCDQNFCSALTGTNPNRLHFWTGTVRPEQNENSRAHVWNDDMDYGTLNWKTFPERLEEQGISWKCYQNEVAIDTGLRGEEDPWLSNFQDNPLEFFGQYNIHLYPRHIEELKKQQSAFQEEIDSLQKQIAGLPAGDALIDHLQKNLHDKQGELDKVRTQPALAAGGNLEGLSPFAQNLHRKAFDTNTGDPDHRVLEDLLYDDNGIQRTMKAPKGDVLHSFRQDVLTGKLPTVSWLSAPENYSDHPSAPWYGAWYVSEALDILTKDPEVWKKTIFILAYDENDGYFDHVPPFTAPNPHRTDTGKVSAGIDTRVDFITEAQEKERNGFPEGPYLRECSIGLGFRVPLVVASPWTRGGYVNSQVFDHTSTLQFLELFLAHRTGKTIRETNISDWRRLVCGDLTSLFHTYNGELIPQPAFVDKDANLENINKAKFKKLPDDFKALTPDEIAVFNKRPQDSPFVTRQEPGTRPSCALPYSMHVHGALSADKKEFVIRMASDDKVFGAATAGAPFNVYAPGNYAVAGKPGQLEPLRTWAYGVKAGDAISDVWPLTEFEGGRYHLRVYGPNGFYREFAGDANDPALGVELYYESAGSRLTGNAGLRLSSHGAACTVELVDHSYGATYPSKHVRAGKTATILLPLAKSQGWYDFSVRVGGFWQRFAGRVETGRDSISDPAMA
ncbi:MAG TPA: phospholipase C, phosphocholine-specific [Puia sp.]|nr:phospholipase C, phosphocholine-specific [Puia sp.]